MFENILNGFNSFLEKLPFDLLVYAVLGAYAAVFLIVLAACLFSGKIKRASKSPFLCFTNAYSAIILAVFLLKCEMNCSLFACAAFWVVGYCLYGLLCLVSIERKEEKKPQFSLPEQTAEHGALSPRSANLPNSTLNPPKNAIRLEHAAAITDKLLSKNLSKSDRTELEKLKNTLAVLRIKGSLTPVEAEILNDNFNALLKLMAKYNV